MAKGRRRRTCASGKARHDSFEKVALAARRMHRELNADGKLAVTTYAYPCPECRYWHVTRRATWDGQANRLANAAPTEALQRWAMASADAA